MRDLGVERKKKFLLKVQFYLENSNDTSLSSIGHFDRKLFNFLIFLEVKRAPKGGGVWGFG